MALCHTDTPCVLVFLASRNAVLCSLVKGQLIGPVASTWLDGSLSRVNCMMTDGVVLRLAARACNKLSSQDACMTGTPLHSCSTQAV